MRLRIPSRELPGVIVVACRFIPTADFLYWFGMGGILAYVVALLLIIPN